MTEDEFRELLLHGLDGIHRWEAGWRPFTPHESLSVAPAQAREAIDALVARLHDNYPFFHPDYAGQMLRPPHPIALIAYALAARINPNNHALDGGPATAQLERECVDLLAAMLGLRTPCLGHLTSSGTIANLEALWVASRLRPGKAVVFSAEAHYTHQRMCDLLGVPCHIVPVDAQGRVDVGALAAAGEHVDIGTVVVSAGTTATGAVDPIADVCVLARNRGWRVHVDAAYGGFFATIAELPEAALDPDGWRAVSECDSIVVDPHKHGLQPYGCGAVLFADPDVGALYKHDSPYTYFTSRELHLGEISLECSRPGAAAAALWTTLRCFPLDRHGIGRGLLASRRAALHVFRDAVASETLCAVLEPQLDIVALAPLARGERMRASVVSERSEAIFLALQGRDEDGSPRGMRPPLYLALWRVPRALGELALPAVDWDAEHCTVLRSVLMKPEHEGAASALAQRLACWPELMPSAGV
ncbi:MAG: aminotransferase class I/II-fold pyridoxal phosphate-dependent enzyme [Candidatus Eremiobacteraeota bacterium]|nr:aminotransferase class I/II-fold pyridoxal phosphate-dependent enzyme [Candidatus Eremiobacteraeota bacterium]